MNPTEQTTLDPQLVNLAKSIRQSESGGNFTAKGKSKEFGAYQFTPDTWNGAVKKYLGQSVDLQKATPQQQNEVAYKQLSDWKKQNPNWNIGNFASAWNAGQGEPDAYKGKFSNGKPSTGTNKFGAKYDVPAYAKSVATAYQTIKNGGNVEADPNNPSSTASTDLTKDEIIGGDIPQQEAPTNKPTISNKLGKVGEAVASVIPGTKLAQGLGQALSNIGGGQDDVIKANNQAIEIQGKLLQKIKADKASGKDTSRLDKALKDITEQIQKTGGQVEDIGTGGIKDKDIWKDAGKLALLPALAYGSTVLKGGGLRGEARGLKSGLLGKSAEVIKPAMKSAINASDKLSFSDILNKGLNANDSVNLSNFEKFSKLATEDKNKVLKYIISKNPELSPIKKIGLGSKLANSGKGLLKGAGWIGAAHLLDSVLGSKVGSKVTSTVKGVIQ